MRLVAQSKAAKPCAVWTTTRSFTAGGLTRTSAVGTGAITGVGATCAAISVGPFDCAATTTGVAADRAAELSGAHPPPTNAAVATIAAQCEEDIRHLSFFNASLTPLESARFPRFQCSGTERAPAVYEC